VNCDEFTGVTIMRMVEKMDAGPILMQVAEPIESDETATDLSARLSELGAEVLIEALMLLESGQITETEQDDAHSSVAPRITRAHAHIDWTLDCAAVARGIRAFDAEPGAWTTLRGSELKLYRPLPDAQWVHVAPAGTVLEVHESDASEGMLVACGKGAVWIREVKAAGKRRMTTAEWARGRTVEVGDRLT
jgi:methionyl-tRNA formyltransferase